MKKGSVAIYILITLIIGLVLGFYFNESTHKTCPPEDIDFSLFWEAYRVLEEKFPDKDRLNEQEIVYGAISGAIKSLDDPYTIFLNPDEAKRFLEDVKGTFEGVGMEIGIREGQLTIIAPLEGTPAQKAGVRAGDKIIKIDDNLTIDITIDEAVDLIRGPKGTKVILTILRQGQETSKEIEIERAVIEIPSLKWEMKEDGIAYIKLYHFS